MSSIESLQWRYAVKKFDNTRSISEDQIAILKEAFNLTATSYGLQPIKLVIIKNKEIQKSLVEHSWNQEQVAQASHLLVICTQNIVDKDSVEHYFKMVKEIRNTPDEILDPFKNYLSDSISQKTKEEIKTWAKNQAYLALGNLLTICALEKIDSCPMEGFIPEKYDETLKLQAQNLSAALVLPVGYRAEDDFMKDLKKVRKSMSEMVLEIH
ncbi:NAD(P)H-dependent oxidoreductase [Flavobacteriaceae bacterium S356]|uniref:NAD(P)H-dependent oxidoreductase n=1 Tax=Asprobacillus argus TaxID=3076534 RepID=A0ABU3LJW9_9FLAO|nr:NAD(P)H-dependent oxidoreductase [Flavobacteriaceae bacterium S356]